MFFTPQKYSAFLSIVNFNSAIQLRFNVKVVRFFFILFFFFYRYH